MRLALFFHLGGDIDMLSPFLTGPKPTDGITRRIIVSKRLLQTNPRLSIVLGYHGLTPDIMLTPESAPEKLRRAVRGCDALLTASETTLNPHRLARALTQEANAAGVETFTLQHGVENVGLTYFDERQGTDVLFASKNVLTWRGTSRMPEIVAGATRSKIIDVGYPLLDDKIFEKWRSALPIPQDDRPIIGVFENLHWTRFSDDYRRRFLDDLQASVEKQKDVVFLLKPHPEGRWFTERFGGKRPIGDNLILSDPIDPVWRLLTAPSLMSLFSGVITTPSKVAFDAALAGKPVAVASYDQPYEHYQGLPALTSKDDWGAFISGAIAASAPDPMSQAFVERTVSSLEGRDRTLAAVQATKAAE